MSLSKKFSQLSGARASSANVKTVRITQNTISQQNQRNNLQNQRRSLGGSTVIIQKGTGKQANNKKSALNLVQKNLANRKNNVKGAAVAGVKGKRGAGKPVQKKEEPKTATDLDMEMDKYWFQAGKGPDPVKLKLDQDMDEYFKGKPATVEATTVATI